MAKIINLRQARKTRDRDARKAEADANAAKHGRTRSARKQEEALTALERQRLDGNRLDKTGEDDDGPG